MLVIHSVKNTRFSFCGRTDGVASREAHHGRAMPGEFLVFFDRSWPQSGPVWVPRIVREQQPRTQPTSGRLETITAVWLAEQLPRRHSSGGDIEVC